MPLITNESHCLSIISNDNVTSILKVSAKTIYNCFVKLKYVTPTALSKWDVICEPSDWKSVFKLPYSCSREPYLQALQYRIIHRFLPCNKWLCNISIKNYNTCDRCGTVDTIEHFLYSCQPVRTFWNEVETWWNSVSPNPVVLTEKHVIFGFYYDLPHFENVNYLLILGKMYIYNCNLSENDVYFNTFLLMAKRKLEIEKIICTNNQTLTKFNKKWSCIVENLTTLYD